MMSPNCVCDRPSMELRTAKPQNMRQTAPATPTTVISMRFLYRRRLRHVTFCVKLSLLQMGVMRSSRILEPLAGALGSSSWAGFSPSIRLATSTAGMTATARPSASAAMLTPQCHCSTIGGSENLAPYAL